MRLPALAAFLALLLVLTSGLGAAARACGMAAATPPPAAAPSHCADMAGHAPSREPAPGDAAEAACMAACALGAVVAAETATPLADAPIRWPVARSRPEPTAAPASADLSTEDPPPRALA